MWPYEWVATLGTAWNGAAWVFVVALTQLVLAAHYWCRQTCGWVSSTDISLRDPVGSSLLVLEEKSYGWVATLRKSTHLISDFSFIAQDLGVMISVRSGPWRSRRVLWPLLRPQLSDLASEAVNPSTVRL